MMAYGIVLTLACPILAIRFAYVERASARAKLIVAAVAFGSFLMPWGLAMVVVQLAISLFVLLYLAAFKNESR